MARKSLTGLDLLLAAVDRALHTLAAVPTARRASPADAEDAATLAEDERRHVAGLMRVNHAGEVAAQALYQGQAFTARSPRVRETMRQAADEEGDHLAWCDQRLRELDSRPSLLNPIWYAGSFAIGALAGTMGDRVSLGFLAETERQVEGHLDDHLRRLPRDDARSRRVLEQMRHDEIRHADTAEAAGAAELSAPIKLLMKLTSRVMTRTAYWL